MKVLVTGGAGFIGSHLSESLLVRGADVVALDDLSTGSVRNIFTFLDDPAYQLVDGSVLDRDLVHDLVDSSDVVVHLASAVGVGLILERPLESMRTIVHGTETVLDAVRHRGIKVLLASTSEVYGKNIGLLNEDADRVLGPTTRSRWAYATAKALDEMLAFAYWREHHVPAVVMRLFNVVGPRQTGGYGMVVPRLVSEALLGNDLVVYGDGEQTRCFCHVADAVRAILALMDEDAAVGDVFNVGSREEVSIIELANLVAEMTNARGSVILRPYDEVFSDQYEDMRRRVPDTSKITELVGWRPRHSLRSIIADVSAFASEIGPPNLLSRGGEQ
jgi:UDP-glucose 4-epimerase